ncbi:spermidine/putrescine ABC transporter periplasmic substrate-binding protein (plasmid) [Sulfitobacter sp. THAF37]|uniref:ABC transporter substrate-binding protein n=1 Tax=Sulfitobacter sp. THAF37 TaxID=2587855 RepID=UPI001268D5CC|nr:ABC transporter substrate-binding protein [Sulfitobacter sp. THAF37]QFT61063.1 spermidine/putrescine ABC transporter periplasmic substrate-binding protein [Sulfitobacter sp. THAF37]
MKHTKFAIGTAALLALAQPAFAQDKVLTIAGSGGVVKEITEKVFLPAYEEATGWSTKFIAAESNILLEVRTMLASGKMLYDAMEVSAASYPIGVKDGLLAPIDYDLLDPDGELPEQAKKEFGVVAAAYSTVLVQRTDKNPEGKKMESWADFWDVETFPGPRSLNPQPQYTLEFALLADGVAREDLYDVLGTEEGLDRAFAKLDEIKPHIPVWWSSGAQSVQLLSDGEVFYSSTYNGRVAKLQESGIPAEIVWNGGALHTSYVGIPKNAPNYEAAHDWIRVRTMRPDLELEYVKQLPYPNFAPGLFDAMPEDVAKTMPTYPANADVQFVADDTFWAENLDEIRERFDEWLLE